MQCPYCRKYIADNSKECSFCGTAMPVSTGAYNRSNLNHNAQSRPTVSRAQEDAAYRYQRQANALYEDQSAKRSSVPSVPTAGKGLSVFGMILSIIGIIISISGVPSVIIGVIGIVLAVISSMRGYLGGIRTACLIISIFSLLLGGFFLLG